MGQLESSLKAALVDRSGTNAWVTRITLPAGDGIWRWSRGPFTSVSEGRFDARIQSYDAIRFVASDAGGSLPTVEATIDVRDDDRLIAHYYEGVNGRKLRGSPVTIRHANTDVVPADWRPLMTGLIANVSWPEPLVARLTFRADDSALRRNAPRPGWRLTLADWPNARSSALGMTAPLLYGSHNSGGYSGKGFVPLICVDEITYTYLLCAGWAKSVSVVYAAGVAVGGYQIEHPMRRGRRYTTIRFDADQGDAAITVDCRGYETDGDGAGMLISNPGEQIAHYLSNFVWGDWQNGPWLATSDRIAPVPLTAVQDYLGARTHIGARYITQPGPAADEITKWLATTETRCWWNGAGQLVLKADDFARTDIYRGPRVLQPAGFSVDEEDSQAVAASVVVHYLTDDSSGSGQFQQTLNVRMPNVEDETADRIDQVWGVAE